MAVGFVNAFLAFQFHSMLFGLVPLWAFAFGYFSSWRIGLLNGFLLFLGYTSAISLMRPGTAFEPVDYFYNFLMGGFALCLIGGAAPVVKKGVRNFKAVIVLIILALLVSWCGYLSLPKYGYYYQVIIHSSEDLDDLELYLPLVAISQKPYTELFNYPLQITGVLTEDYSLEVVDTEHGRMLKLGISRLQGKDRPPPVAPPGAEPPPAAPKPLSPLPPEHNYPYFGNIIFKQSNVGHEKLRFLPKYEAEEVKIVRLERFLGPIRVRANEAVEEFKVPLKVNSRKQAEVMVRLENRSNGSMAINFANSIAESYSESFKFYGVTSDEWVIVNGEAVSSLSIGGPD